MKNHPHRTFPHARQALLLAIAFGASTAIAQTSTTGSRSTTTDTTRQSTPSTSTDSGYQTKAAADVESTRDINAQTTANNREKLSWGDRRFVHKAADGGQDEIQIAQLAAQRATNPDVRAYAQKLVDDHTKVSSELTTLASQKGVTVDKDNDKDRAYKRLNKKSGSDFDQEFVDHMIDEHEKDIKMFEKAASDAKDADIRSFASKHVADLRGHQTEAQNLQQSLMPTGRTDSSSGRSSSSSYDTTPSSSSTSTTTPSSSSTSTDSSTSSSSSSSDTQPRKNR